MHKPLFARQPLLAIFVFLPIAAFCCGCICSARQSGETVASLASLLKSQAANWDRAIITKDLPAIAANMTDDFRQIRSNGSVINRDTFLRDISSPDLVIDPYTVEDFDVRIYGDVALLSGRTRMTGRYAGEVFTTHYRYIDIYVKKGGQWRVCSVQTTSIPEQPNK